MVEMSSLCRVVVFESVETGAHSDVGHIRVVGSSLKNRFELTLQMRPSMPR